MHCKFIPKSPSSGANLHSITMFRTAILGVSDMQKLRKASYEDGG